MRSFSRQSSGLSRIRTDTAKLCWNQDGGNLPKRQWFVWCVGWQGKTLTPLFPDYFSSGFQMLPRKHSDTWHLTLRLAKIPPRAFVTLGWNYGLLDVCNVQNANNAKRRETAGGGGGGGGPLNKERKGQEEQWEEDAQTVMTKKQKVSEIFPQQKTKWHSLSLKGNRCFFPCSFPINYFNLNWLFCI